MPRKAKTEEVKTEEKPVEKISAKEVEEIIVELGKKGISCEKIGLELKNKHNVDAKKLGLKISKVLKKHKLFNDPDIKNLSDNVAKLQKHLEKNKHDFSTKKAFLKMGAKLHILKKYRKIA